MSSYKRRGFIMDEVKFGPQDVISETVGNILVSSWEDVVNLGSENLRVVTMEWDKEVSKVDRNIERMQEALVLLEGGFDVIFDEAAKFDCVLEEKSVGTTLNKCVACRYSTFDLFHHRPLHCLIVPDECQPYQLEAGNPCYLTYKRVEVSDCLEHVRNSLEEAIGRKAQMGRFIEYLLRAANEAEDRPLLPAFRSYAEFEVGETVLCCCSKRALVSCIDDDPVVDVDFGNDVQSVSRRDLLHEWEYRYLKEHTEFAKTWCYSIGDGSVGRWKTLMA